LTLESWFSVGAVLLFGLSLWNAITSTTGLQLALNIVQMIGWAIAAYAFYREAE
jgi:hypothetical protein